LPLPLVAAATILLAFPSDCRLLPPALFLFDHRSLFFSFSLSPRELSLAEDPVAILKHRGQKMDEDERLKREEEAADWRRQFEEARQQEAEDQRLELEEELRMKENKEKEEDDDEPEPSGDTDIRDRDQ
jgi:hypothetical protein